MIVADLPRVIKREKPVRKRAIIVRPIQTAAMLARELLTVYMKVIRAWQQQIRERVIPAYSASMAARDGSSFADTANSIDHSIQAASGKVVTVVLSAPSWLKEWTARMEAWHRSQFAAATKAATDVDVSSMIGPDTAGVQEAMSVALARNVALITNVSDDMQKRISEAVWQGYTVNSPVKIVADVIIDQVQIEADRAKLIAQDQAVKLAAALDQERQTELGIDQFVWRHSGKKNFRPEHKARDGQVFSWDDNNLEGDLPGMAINCGCKAQAYIDLGSM